MQREYYNTPSLDWDSIYFEWLAWGLPIDDFYNYPSHTIVKVWQGVKRVKAQEANALSSTVATIAHMIYEYIRDHEKSGSRPIEDFLPYDLKTAEQSQMIDKETATCVILARDAGNLPANILSVIVAVPNLYQAILLMAEQTSKGENGFKEV
jgi:hypothetical protein